jgi:exosortase
MENAKSRNVIKIKQKINYLLQESIKTSHNRFVACGLLAGFCYVPFWLADLVIGTLHGAASILMVAAIALGLYQLRCKRYHLAKLKASEEDEWLGHLLIASGVILSPFCFFSEWSQRLVWMLILAGIACSTWGINFFKHYPIPTFLIFMGLFPQPTVVGKVLWETFTPPKMLEQFMAWSGTLGLQAIGQSATVNQTIISLPGGAVDVAWGCSGFDMATIIAVASLVLGLFLKQSLPKVVFMVILGVILALLSNIPRIMLMAMAEAYWGKAAFEFWHGFWGGQIFSTILFTIYYYAVMALIKHQKKRSH